MNLIGIGDNSNWNWILMSLIDILDYDNWN